MVCLQPWECAFWFVNSTFYESNEVLCVRWFLLFFSSSSVIPSYSIVLASVVPSCYGRIRLSFIILYRFFYHRFLFSFTFVRTSSIAFSISLSSGFMCVNMIFNPAFNQYNEIYCELKESVIWKNQVANIGLRIEKTPPTNNNKITLSNNRKKYKNNRINSNHW